MQLTWAPSHRPGLAPARAHCSRSRIMMCCMASSSEPRTCIVVGGGVGGLALAGRLAQAGMQTLVLEQNDKVGGRACTEGVGGFRWDTGPSLLLFPQQYREAFAAAGRDSDEFFEMRRVHPGYRLFYGDGSTLDMLYDVDAMAAQLERVERGAGAAYRRWLAAARAALEAGMAQFIDRNLDSLGQLAWDVPSMLPLLQRVGLPDLLGNHHGRLGAYFRDPRLKALFSFQDLYVGLSPYNAPAAFSLLAATELVDGVWYPMGGFERVVDGLRTVAEERGAVVRTGVRVEEVIQEGGRVAGVRTADGQVLQADVVVKNRDLPAAYRLLNSPYGAARGDALDQKRYSAGVIAYYWGVSTPLPALQHHNVFISDEYEASWRRATAPGMLRPRPNFYACVPNRTDPGAAPPGCESLMVLLPVANMAEMRGAGADPSDYSALIDAGRERIFAALEAAGAGDVFSHIAHERVTAPPQWGEQYGLRHGAAFGLDHGLDQLAMFRPSNKDEQVRGLYFVGASTRPGNGVPLCLISAKLTAERVLADMR